MSADIPHGRGAPAASGLRLLDRSGELRGAGRWARVTAILGFILAGLSALAVPVISLGARAMAANTADAFEAVLPRLFFGISTIAFIVTSSLLLRYCSKLSDGLGGHAAAFAQAFRSLRYALIVWTALGTLSLLYTLFALGKAR